MCYLFISTKSYGSHDHDLHDSESHQESKRSLRSIEQKKDIKVEAIETDLEGMKIRIN